MTDKSKGPSSAAMGIVEAPADPSTTNSSIPSGAAQIILGNGMRVLVDAADFPALNTVKWNLFNGYAARQIGPAVARRIVYMHRELCPTDARTIDHINMDRLDNRRANLRPASYSENVAHRGLSKTNTSGYRGVSRHCYQARHGKQWRASIRAQGRLYWLGLFHTKEAAALAYNAAARELFGAFAYQNQIPTQAVR